ncbi:holin [Ectopseudomonas mendocina]|nr:holin [Pseudomonas mendocina]
MNGVSYTGAATSVVSGLTLTEWGVVVGIITALVTLVANLFYQRQKNKREQHLYELELQFSYKARQDAHEEGAQQ